MKTNKNVPLILSLSIGSILFVFLVSTNLSGSKKFEALDKSMDYIVQITSIFAGIVIAFLASKIIQLRQEKLQLKPQLIQLSRKLNCFRKVIHLLSSDYLFWQKGLRDHIEKTYPGITFYDVRDITFIDVEITQQAREFIKDEKFGELKKQVYLEMKSFLPSGLYERMLYDAYDSDEIYPIEQLLKWTKYECGGVMCSTFVDKYQAYLGQFNFDSIPEDTQIAIKNLSSKIDKERYKNIKFGASLIGELGSQVSLEILPKLTKVQLSFQEKMPIVIQFMYKTLFLLLICGAIIPIVLINFNLPVFFKQLTLSLSLGIMLYFLIKLYYVMEEEIFVEQNI